MNVKIENLEKNVLQLEIEVDAEKFEEGVQKAYLKNVKKFNVSGFRKGKAPRKIIETYYGEGVFYEDAVNIIIPEAYADAVEQEKIDTVDQPEVDITQIGAGENFIFTAKVTIKPEVELGEYKGIEVNKIEYNVTEDDVNKELQQMQEKNARLVTIEDRSVETGDQVLIDFEGFTDGKPFEGGTGNDFNLEIGSGQFIPGFEEQLVGKNIGEEVEVDVTFPEEYQAEDLAGKPALFKVTVKEIKYKELPTLDDEFAKDVSEYDTLEELKQDITKKLTEQAEHKAKHEFEDAVVDKIVENATVEIPEVMIQQKLDNMLKDYEMRLKNQGLSLEQYLQFTGMDINMIREESKEQAEKQVKIGLIIEKIGKVEAFEITEEDIEKELTKLAENYNMEVDKIKEMLKPNENEGFRNDLLVGKTIDMLVENAKVID